MRKIHWGFFFAGIFSLLLFVITFFQNFNPLFVAYWAFLFNPNLTHASAIVIGVGFVNGFLTALFFLLCVRGSHFDPVPSAEKEQPDTWDREADQF